LNQSQNLKENKRNKTGLNSFVRYSGMGFQMIAIILLFYWAGSKLDERSSNEKPVYTAILTLLGVFAGLYIVLKDFIFRKDD
jgi:ATP synthase protein I